MQTFGFFLHWSTTFEKCNQRDTDLKKKIMCFNKNILFDYSICMCERRMIFFIIEIKKYEDNNCETIDNMDCLYLNYNYLYITIRTIHHVWYIST